MKRSVSLALLALALCACGASAMRAPEWARDRVATTSGGKEPAYILIKYRVPPAVQDDFVDKWERFEKGLGREKALGYYVLSKTLDDNVKFYSYCEWDTYNDFMDHLEAGYMKDFKEFLDKEDIELEILPVEPITDTEKEYRRNSAPVARRRRARWDEQDPRELPAHVMFQFHVPPSMTDKFEDTLEAHLDRVMDEKEITHFAIRKVSSMNHHYVACAAWESLEGWFDHFTSKHVRNFFGDAAENEVEIYATCVRPLAIGGYKERE